MQTKRTVPTKHSYIVAETEKIWSLEHETFGRTDVDIEEAIAALVCEIPVSWDILDLTTKVYNSREIMLSAKMAEGISIEDYQEALKLHTLLISFFDSLFVHEAFTDAKKDKKSVKND